MDTTIDLCAKDDESDKKYVCWQILVIHFDNTVILSYDHAKLAMIIFQSR